MVKEYFYVEVVFGLLFFIFYNFYKYYVLLVMLLLILSGKYYIFIFNNIVD